MFLKSWRLLTVLLTALSMSVAMCHLLEMPAKLGYEGALWLTLLQTLYPPAFGPIGGTFEAGAVVSTIVLAFLVRNRRPALAWSVLAALCMVATHAVFWIWVAPVNDAMLPHRPHDLPANWMALRQQWEYSHAIRAGLQLLALGLLGVSILVEVPVQFPPGANAQRDHSSARRAVREEASASRAVPS